MAFTDYYQIMGVSKDATQDDIKRAYRKLARKYHPDVSQESDAEAKFKAVGEAYEVLKDPEKRAQYDQFGREWKNAAQAEQARQRGQSQQSTYQHSHSEADFAEFLNQMFGQGRQRQRGFGFEADLNQGQDIHTRLDISLEDSYLGAEKMLQLHIPTLDARGGVSSKTKTVKVNIPKGILDGQQIRLKGQGHESANGHAGDLYIEVHLLPHRLYHVEGKNILLDVPIAPWEAALGSKIEIQTLGGKVAMKCPENTQNGQQMRLKGRGLPGNPAGDQIVRFQIAMPKKVSSEAKKAYEQLRDAQAYNPRAGME
ncbi:DnaJ C-terminal domain-containing protein [Legionella sp. W05-934-2]|jgi:curved DNA-binding protein|uniref:DnaJ C-terminal domain-containing protein n=1 Tax=Legionella sp. W05-934-2 TaxID=1198649 RepID=UPI00346306DD